jgi:hypothetical protein
VVTSSILKGNPSAQSFEDAYIGRVYVCIHRGECMLVSLSVYLLCCVKKKRNLNPET